jgi:hypothetical protein
MRVPHRKRYMVVKKLAEQRSEALVAFVEQQGWQQSEEMPPSFSPHTHNRRQFIITDGETTVTISIALQGGLNLWGDEGALKLRLLEWIRLVQPKATVLKRELRSYESSRAKSRGKAWIFDRGSWQLTDDDRYNRVEEANGIDLEKAIRQAGYNSGMPMRLGVPESHFTLEIYTSQRGENIPSSHYPYFVKVHISSHDEWIYVTDFPSLISLFDQLGALIEKVQHTSQ